jgi:alcohol/geraniol dehydrogenase (NADP+)
VLNRISVFRGMYVPQHRVGQVGIVGIGGLGHLALQFARAMGGDVTAFTGSHAKSDEAKSFGAHAVVDYKVSELGGLSPPVLMLVVPPC